MPGETSDLVFLGRVHTRLPAIGRQAAQKICIAPACTSIEHQPVKPVILHLPGPHRHESILKSTTRFFKIDTLACFMAHHQIMHPIDIRGILSGFCNRAHRITGFKIDKQTHIFKHRHRLRQGNRLTARIYLCTNYFFTVLVTFVDTQTHRRFIAKLRQLRNITQSFLGWKCFSVSSVKPFCKKTCPIADMVFKGLAGQGCAERIFPTCRKAGNLALQHIQIRFGPARFQGELNVQAHELSGIKPRLKALQLGVKSISQKVNNPGADLGFVGIARDKNKRRDEPVKLVTAHKKARMRTPHKLNNPLNNRGQRFSFGLEQLIARPCLQNIGKGFGSMPARLCARHCNHALKAAADQRNTSRCFIISISREETHKARLSNHTPLFIIMFDPNIISANMAMHARNHGRLGNDQWFRPLQECPNRTG